MPNEGVIIFDNDPGHTLLDDEAYWLHREAASRRVLARVLHENYVRTKCLETAMKTLEHYATSPINLLAQCTLVEIKQRLAELEPEGETK